MWVIIARGGASYIFSVLYFRRGKSGTSTFPTLPQFTTLFLTKSDYQFFLKNYMLRRQRRLRFCCRWQDLTRTASLLSTTAAIILFL